MSLYGLSEEEMTKAKNEYGEEVRESLKDSGMKPVKKAKEVVNRKNAFFAEETEENKTWLIEHNYLEPEPSVITPVETPINEDESPNTLTGEYIRVPAAVFQSIIEKIKQTEKLVKELKEEISNLKSNAAPPPEPTPVQAPVDPLEKAKKKFMKMTIQQYVSGGCSKEEAIEEAGNDWDSLEDEEKQKYI